MVQQLFAGKDLIRRGSEEVSKIQFLRRHVHRVAFVEDGIVRQVDDEIRILHIFSLLFCRSGHTDRGRLIAAENSLDSGDKFF